jgi:hypothetical protein
MQDPVSHRDVVRPGLRRGVVQHIHETRQPVLRCERFASNGTTRS